MPPKTGSSQAVNDSLRCDSLKDLEIIKSNDAHEIALSRERDTVYSINSKSCTKKALPLSQYNISYLGILGRMVILKYGYGGNWSGIIQYDLDTNGAAFVNGALGDDRNTAISKTGILVSNTISDSYCFFAMNASNIYEKKECMQLGGKGGEPELASFSDNGKYFAVYSFDSSDVPYIHIYEVQN